MVTRGWIPELERIRAMIARFAFRMSVLPAALAANWLASAWDNNSGLSIMSPITARLEEIALRWLVEETARSAGIRGVEQYPEDLPVLSDDANIALYRIAQESLTNVVKHARASEIRLKLSCDDVHLCLIIEDDGVGIAAECVAVAQSHGLLSMRHRAAALDGELRVTRPASGRGTRIEVIMSLRRAAA